MTTLTDLLNQINEAAAGRECIFDDGFLDALVEAGAVQVLWVEEDNAFHVRACNGDVVGYVFEDLRYFNGTLA